MQLVPDRRAGCCWYEHLYSHGKCSEFAYGMHMHAHTCFAHTCKWFTTIKLFVKWVWKPMSRHTGHKGTLSCNNTADRCSNSGMLHILTCEYLDLYLQASAMVGVLTCITFTMNKPYAEMHLKQVMSSKWQHSQTNGMNMMYRADANQSLCSNNVKQVSHYDFVKLSTSLTHAWPTST